MPANLDLAVKRQRIDKWLWHARMVRTRSDAAGLADAGHVRINGRRIAAASYAVKPGDVITVSLDSSVRVMRVLDVADRRTSSSAARSLYEPVDRESTQADEPQHVLARRQRLR